MSITIIAEIGNTHEGSLGLAKKFIDSIKESGADAVKFQTHIFEAESLPNAPNPPYFKDETRKEYFERTAFDGPQYLELKNYSESQGLIFQSSPFSLEAVDFLEQVGVSSYKIPSGEVTNLPLLEKVAACQKQVFLSSGMSNWNEIDQAVNVLKTNGVKDLVIFQCTSMYPCPPKDTGINIMLEMKNRYDCEIGLSDHTLGYGAAAAAIAHGASYIEKHFTLSKLMYGSDAKHSMEPADFSLFCNTLREVHTAVSSHVDKDQLALELKDMKQIFEKSITASENLSNGTIIKKEMLRFKKPGNGISASKYKDVIGRELKTNILADQLLQFSDFK